MAALAGILTFQFGTASAPAHKIEVAAKPDTKKTKITGLSALPEMCEVEPGSYRSLPRHLSHCRQIPREYRTDLASANERFKMHVGKLGVASVDHQRAAAKPAKKPATAKTARPLTPAPFVFEFNAAG